MTRTVTLVTIKKIGHRMLMTCRIVKTLTYQRLRTRRIVDKFFTNLFRAKSCSISTMGHHHARSQSMREATQTSIV